VSDRREFLKTAARLSVGALLGGGIGWRALGGGRPCFADGGCRRCPDLDHCDLPEARLARLQRRPRSSVDHPEPTAEEPGN